MAVVVRPPELEDWLKPIMIKIAAEGKTRACATLGATGFLDKSAQFEQIPALIASLM